jgi:hypothetical protein
MSARKSSLEPHSAKFGNPQNTKNPQNLGVIPISVYGMPRAASSAEKPCKRSFAP